MAKNTRTSETPVTNPSSLIAWIFQRTPVLVLVLVLVGIFFLTIVVWVVADRSAQPGGQVKVLWGFVEYTKLKKGEKPATQSSPISENKDSLNTDSIKGQPVKKNRYCQIINRSSGKYLEVDRCRDDDNAPILQLNFRNDNKCQLFELIPIGTLFQIKNAKSTRPQCLDVDECKKENGVDIKQFPCRDEKDNNVRCQEFDLIKVKDSYQIRSLVSHKCLDVAGCGNDFDGVQIKQCECRENNDNLQASQLFDLIPVQITKSALPE